jgi:hypothetical protein
MKINKMKKAFISIEIIIVTILYTILAATLIGVYRFYVDYENEIKFWNKYSYIKNFIEDYDKVVCYK